MNTGKVQEKKRGGNGFSLVEVLLSLVLLTAVMSLTARLMVSEIRGNHSGRLYTKATGIATSMIEKLIQVDYEDLTDYDNFNTDSTPPGVEPAHSDCAEWKELLRSELPDGYGEIDIQYDADLSRMEVKVRFDADGIEHEVKLETMRNNVL